MDVNYLLLSMIYSTVGLGMFIYGKKAVRMVPLIAGLALMIIPFFLTNLLWMTIASAALMASPFVFGKYDL
jgi:hypothetical protein